MTEVILIPENQLYGGYSSDVNEKSMTWDTTDEKNVAHARALALDILDKIGTGHPGATLSLMPLVYLLYSQVLLHDPRNPNWECRDKLVLSCGHLSLAQYIQLNFSGYDITLDDLKSFRTLGSITPGHPEIHKTPGIESTTGPLGQGFATAVGMALSDAIHFKNSQEIDCDREIQVFVIASDGDIHEGITYEAASLASLYNLRNLTVIYDSNGITIDGSTAMNSVVDVESYFRAMNWHVQKVSKSESGDLDAKAILKALSNAKNSERPSLVILDTIIGWPSPNWQDSSRIHGNVLPSEELFLTKSALGVDLDDKFPLDLNELNKNKARILQRCAAHRCGREKSKLKPILGKEFQELNYQISFPDSISTRKANALILDKLQNVYPWVIGGSADLTESNSLSLKNLFNNQDSEPSVNGTNLIFGVREHAMSAISNGIATDSQNVAFCATYLVFSDYQKPAIRLAALMDLPTVFVWTHDSIAIGADGPTHQPIDQLAMLRAIPNFSVVRPSSANELKEVWKRILLDRKPVGLVLSRQDLPNPEIPESVNNDIRNGAYTVFENMQFESPNLVLVATGSEVSIAVEASKKLAEKNIQTRVVSMLSFEWFKLQSSEYKLSILGDLTIPKISIEAASTFGWAEFIGNNGLSIGIDTFGESGEGSELQTKYGFSIDNIVAKSIALVAEVAKSRQ